MSNITYLYISNFAALISKNMNNVESLLKEKGLTKTALSEMLGIKKQNLNGLMKNPTLETLQRFATVLDVPIWQLFASKEEIMKEEGSSGPSIECPHCGKRITIKVE